MKASQPIKPKPPFMPIHLILESQAEVDAIFSILNHLDIRKALELPPGLYEILLDYADKDNSAHLHENLTKLINRNIDCT